MIHRGWPILGGLAVAGVVGSAIALSIDAHAALEPATSLAIVELFGSFGNHSEAIVVEPIEQRSDWGEFLILDDYGVVKRARQNAAVPEFR